MYYGGASDYARMLSAISSDGLNFAREDGVRLDKLCPPEGGAPGITPIIDALGTFHTFTRATRCTGNYVNSKAGLFDGTTTDGLAINIASSPFAQGYSKDGTLANQVEPEDFTVVQTPEGLRVYFSSSTMPARSSPKRPFTASSIPPSSRKTSVRGGAGLESTLADAVSL